MDQPSTKYGNEFTWQISRGPQSVGVPFDGEGLSLHQEDAEGGVTFPRMFTRHLRAHIYMWCLRYLNPKIILIFFLKLVCCLCEFRNVFSLQMLSLLVFLSHNIK